MSALSEFLQFELYPALFDRIEFALPEFAFKRTQKGYRSGTDLKITGERGEKGKVYIYDNNPSQLIDYTRNSISVFDYLQQRDGLDNAQTLQLLAELSNVQLPRFDANQTKYYDKQRRESQIREDAHQFFCQCRMEQPTSSNSFADSLNETRIYLQQRGYSETHLQNMEIGFIPPQNVWLAYLSQTKKYTHSDIFDALQLPQRAGNTHCIAIPLRDFSGNLRGILARAIKPEQQPKYLYPTGLEKNSVLFNLAATRKAGQQRHVVIVEGILDALHATARHIPEIAALGGTSLNAKQLDALYRCGVRSITLCLDNDTAGEQATQRAAELISKDARFRLYIAQLPKECKDPDDCLRIFGEDVFLQLLDTAIPAYQYLLHSLLQKHNPENTLLSPKKQDELLVQIIELISSLSNPLVREQVANAAGKYFNDVGITSSGIEEAATQMRTRNEAANFDNAIKKILVQAQADTKKGNSKRVLQYLHEQSRELLNKNLENVFEQLRNISSEADLIQRLATRPAAIRTGYTIENEDLLLPAGALSLLCAPTSHGKTTFLLNLALNIAQLYPEKQVHFFTYEEDADSIMLNALNTFINQNLSSNNRRSIKAFFAEQTDRYVQKMAMPTFVREKNRFFDELITTSRLNIHYTDFDSDTLINALHYLHQNTSTCVVLIDYMQLLYKKKLKVRFNSRQEELKEICLNLKNAAVETGLPLVLGAQFNREVLSPNLLHPTRIGEAGDLERIANLILGFWNNNFDPQASDAALAELRNAGFLRPDTLYVKVLKNRGGVANRAESMEFNGNTGKISNVMRVGL